MNPTPSSFASLPGVWACILACSSAASQATPAAEPSPASAAFARVCAEMDAGRAPAAGEMLARLLQEPAHKAWALARRDAVLEEARRIAFWASYAPPPPGALVSGVLEEWVPRTGDIALVYGADTMADFATIDQGVLVHPLTFRGDHGISLRGPSLSSQGVRLLVAANAHASYRVSFGAGIGTGEPALVEVHRLGTAASDRVGEAVPSPLRAGEPFRVGVRVSATGLRVLVDGKTLLQVDKDAAQVGQVGLWPTAFAEVRIEGKASSAWLDGRCDQHQRAARTRFDATFDLRSIVPDWLLAAPVTEAAADAANGEPASYPCELGSEHADAVAECVRLLEEQQWDACLQRTASANAGTLPVPAVVWLRALAFAGKRDFGAATLCAGDVLRQAPDFVRARELLARLAWGAGDRRQALAQARQLVRDHPDYVDAVAALITFELCVGDRAAAFALQASARDRGLRSPELERIGGMLAKADRGPDWRRRFIYRSPHYEVASDIDHKTCIDVANTMEESLATVCTELGGDLRRVGSGRVFVFAGESGYRAYLDDVSGTVPIHTAGLYSTALRQLLLWQTADRDRMLQTARHEGVHQYLDLVLPEPPRWFDEGLAQYYEMASARGGRVGAASWRTASLRRLEGRALVPLAQFLAWNAAQFYAQPELAYGQSWALVCMLREGGHARRALLEDIFGALADGTPAADVVARLLPPERMRELDGELRDWIARQAR